MEKPPENVVVMTNLGPARFQNGCWFKWDLKLGRGQIVAHREQEGFTSWSQLVVEPWMRTTWNPNFASPMTLYARAGIGLDGSPLGNHTQPQPLFRRLTNCFSKKIQHG